jgi:hypothetical protein
MTHKLVISEKLISLHDNSLANAKHVIKVSKLHYPCKDRSDNISNFKDWSYFKNNQMKIVNMSSSSLWNKKIINQSKQLALEKRQGTPKKSKLPPIKTTKSQKMREKFTEDRYSYSNNLDELSVAYAVCDTSSIASSTIHNNKIQSK